MTRREIDSQVTVLSKDGVKGLTTFLLADRRGSSVFDIVGIFIKTIPIYGTAGLAAGLARASPADDER